VRRSGRNLAHWTRRRIARILPPVRPAVSPPAAYAPTLLLRRPGGKGSCCHQSDAFAFRRLCFPPWRLGTEGFWVGDYAGGSPGSLPFGARKHPQQCHALRFGGWRGWRGSNAGLAGRGCVQYVCREHMFKRVTCWICLPNGGVPRGPLPKTPRSYRQKIWTLGLGPPLKINTRHTRQTVDSGCWRLFWLCCVCMETSVFLSV